MRDSFTILMVMFLPLIGTFFGAAQTALAEASETQTQLSHPFPQASKPELTRPAAGGEPTEVKVLLYIIDVDDVDSANQSFAASVYYEALWHNPHLRHENPEPIMRGLTEVWTPQLVIVNQQQAWSAFPASVKIRPSGEVIHAQKVWGWFSQPLNLRDFPFDRQKLTIHLVTAGLLESEVKVVPLETAIGDRSGIAPNFSLPDFDVISWTVEPRPYISFEGEEGTAGFIMEIEIERRPSFFVWKVIFPLCLIVIMSWVPRWIDPKHIGTNVGIATTSFLTLVAYLFAITVLLPRVSYFTRMDEFIMLSTLMVFIGLLHTVATSVLAQTRTLSPLVARVDRFGQIVYPVILIAVLWVAFAL